MVTIVIYSPYASTRLSYVLDWLIRERLQQDYVITTDEATASDAPYCMCYGNYLPGKISIPDAGFLHTSEPYNDALPAATTAQESISPATGHWQQLPVLFYDGSGDSSLPFDIFSAIFFLLSRYEEYLPYTPDRHGRYPATESILYKQGWLHRPIADEWVHNLKLLLEKEWHVSMKVAAFTIIPSYDIDMAYSHAYKGIKRIVGAYIRALLKGDVEQINQRTQVLKKKVTDPYDSFSWLRQLHERYHYRPLYFILCALRTTAFDKNIHPRHPAMTRVIKQLSKEGEVGIHPSYYATHYDRVAKEKSTLSAIINKAIPQSRQHYIRLVIPTTYHVLMDNDITDDHSMGYGTHLGFRAGTGASFLWYDLKKEAVTPLRVHPFCFMDTTAHYDMGLPVTDAFAELNKMKQVLQKTNSTMVTIFHNFSLGTDKEWAGWSDAYEEFMRGLSAS